MASWKTEVRGYVAADFAAAALKLRDAQLEAVKETKDAVVDAQFAAAVAAVETLIKEMASGGELTMALEGYDHGDEAGSGIQVAVHRRP